MLKQFFKISFYSFIAFCVISFISLIYSILYNKINGTFPNFKIGFPFTYHYQFLVRDNCKGFELLHGSDFKNFIYDIVFSLIIVFSYFQLKNNIKLLNHFKQN